MLRLFDKASVLLRMAVSQYIAYRAGVVIWMLHGIVPLITMLVWMMLAEDGPIGGRNPVDFAAYFLAVFFISQITAGLIGEVERDIRFGRLSAKLLLPLIRIGATYRRSWPSPLSDCPFSSSPSRSCS